MTNSVSTHCECVVRRVAALCVKTLAFGSHHTHAISASREPQQPHIVRANKTTIDMDLKRFLLLSAIVLGLLHSGITYFFSSELLYTPLLRCLVHEIRLNCFIHDSFTSKYLVPYGLSDARNVFFCCSKATGEFDRAFAKMQRKMSFRNAQSKYVCIIFSSK